MFNLLESLEARALFSAGGIDVAFNGGALLSTVFKTGPSQINDIDVLPDGSIIASGNVQKKKMGIVSAQYMAIAKYRFDGTLDPTFGDSGEIAATPRGVTNVYRLLLTSDGGFYMQSTSPTVVLKFTAAGKVDPSFGDNGELKVSGAPLLAVDANDRLYVSGGKTVEGSQQIVGYIRRYTPSGQVDPTFNGGNDVSFGPIGKTQTQTQYRTMVFANVMFDSQGRLLFTAEDSLFANSQTNHLDVEDNYLYRLTSNGKIDRSFGSFGNVVLPAGRINNGTMLADDKTMFTLDEHLIRRNADGSVDNLFGNNGISTFQNGGRVAIASDGSAAFNYTADDVNQQTHFSIQHIKTNGFIDTDFGNNGTTSLNVSSQSHVNGLAIAPDGTIVAGGILGDISISGNVDTRSFGLARLLSTEAPALQLVPRTLKTASRYLSFNVLIRDDDGVDATTLDDSDLKLFDADGNTRKIRFLSSQDVNGDGKYIRATYRIIGPNSLPWSIAANGTYEVRLQRKQIADTDGNNAAAQVLGTVRVKIV